MCVSSKAWRIFYRLLQILLIPYGYLDNKMETKRQIISQRITNHYTTLFTWREKISAIASTWGSVNKYLASVYRVVRKFKAHGGYKYCQDPLTIGEYRRLQGIANGYFHCFGIYCPGYTGGIMSCQTQCWKTSCVWFMGCLQT